MKYLPEIQGARGNPELLEGVYRTARKERGAEEFEAALMACYRETPDDVLYAAWYYRLQQVAQEDGTAGRRINWKLAIPLSVAMGLLFWILSGPGFAFSDRMPYSMLVGAPIGACFAIAFLTITADKRRKLPLLTVIGLLSFCLYVTLFTALQGRQHYRILMALHLPLLAWIGAGLTVPGIRSEPRNRFAFLIKSIDVFTTGGLYLLAGGAFVAITAGMFGALGVKLSGETVQRLVAGVAGLVPVLAVACVYDPHASPIAQEFQQGQSGIISTLMRLLLPLTLLVLIIYLFMVPFNFMEPFHRRETLIVYNVMLFAVMGLLVGATPVCPQGMSPGQQSALRAGILAVAALAALVSLYALSAVVYRTAQGGLTVNRLAVIGWNSINIGILLLLLYRQIRDGAAMWARSAQSAFSLGIRGYTVWALFLTLAIPLLFRE